MLLGNCFLFYNLQSNVIEVLGLDTCHTLKANLPPEADIKKIIIAKCYFSRYLMIVLNKIHLYEKKCTSLGPKYFQRVTASHGHSHTLKVFLFLEGSLLQYSVSRTAYSLAYQIVYLFWL